MRSALIAALTAGVPVAAISSITALRANIGRTLIILALYEFTLLIIKFGSDVLGGLQGRWTTRTTERLDAWLQRKFSSFTRAYMRYVTAATKYMDVKGLTTVGEHILEMQDVLVRLSLVPTGLHALSPDPIQHGVKRRREANSTVWHWLQRANAEHRVLAIVGPPGSGKTTLLRTVAYALASGQARHVTNVRRIPILINLRDHRNWSNDSGINLEAMLEQSLFALDRKPPPAWLETNLRHGNLAILLDGLDEMKDEESRRSLSTWIEQQINGHPNNLFVITSRPFGYRENPVNGATVVEVQPLTDEQVTAFVESWYQAISIRSYGADNESSRLSAKTGAADLLVRLDANPAIADLSANPLLLTMVANVHRYRGALPGSRAELYGEICDVLLGKRHTSRGVPVDMPGRQKQVVLRQLAYKMMLSNATDIVEDKAAKAIGPILTTVSDTLSPSEFLRSVEQASGLLIEKERGVYTFAHLTFQEYLAAEYIRDNNKVSDLLRNISTPWWRETIKLFSAISDVTAIVHACLAHKDNPDLVALAAQCAEEGREIAQAARRAVDECLNPPDARVNPASRHVAARVGLQLKTGRDVPIHRRRFISKSAITWLEYQYFIETATPVTSAGRKDSSWVLTPDHWTDDIYPENQDNEHAKGIGFRDAQRFCDWLNKETQSGSQYRLPYAHEIKSALDAGQIGPFDGSTGYWTAPSSGDRHDGRFWPLLRQPHTDQSHTIYPTARSSAEHAIVEAAWEADTSLASSAHTPDAASSTGSGHSHPRDFTDRALREIFDRCYEQASTCDVSQLQHDSKLATALVEGYIELNSNAAGAIPRLQNQLKFHAGEVQFLFSRALDRSRFDARGTQPMIDRRKAARGAALEAAAICLELHAEHGGSYVPPRTHDLPKPTRKVPNPSRLPTVAMTVLAHAFIAMYVDLVILEARISGELAPTESLVYVRDVAALRPVWQVPDLQSGPTRTWHLVKPILDRVAAAGLLVLLAPLLAAIACAVLTTGWPILFRHLRVGHQAREFIMVKFRTMSPNADEDLDLSDGGIPDGAAASSILFKLRDDPRVTRVGKFLRRYSLDELPQLLNVLRGQMSMVGPRPPLPSEVSTYDKDDLKRLMIKPGLTGLWQVSGRSDLSWEESLRLDLRYVDNASLTLDLLILWKTIGAVLRGDGSY
jgi:lipopolysaccharide/colanic/teichoic acid biosynthesis glycosyltransferase